MCLSISTVLCSISIYLCYIYDIYFFDAIECAATCFCCNTTVGGIKSTAEDTRTSLFIIIGVVIGGAVI